MWASSARMPELTGTTRLQRCQANGAATGLRNDSGKPSSALRRPAGRAIIKWPRPTEPWGAMSPPDDRPTLAAPPRRRRDRALLRNLALVLVIVATALFLLQQLAALLKPLLLAVFLAYIILPA